MYRTGRYPDYLVACNNGSRGVSITCAIPYSRSFIWRAKPLLVGNYSVGQIVRRNNAIQGLVLVQYRYQPI